MNNYQINSKVLIKEKKIQKKFLRKPPFENEEIKKGPTNLEKKDSLNELNEAILSNPNKNMSKKAIYTKEILNIDLDGPKNISIEKEQELSKSVVFTDQKQINSFTNEAQDSLNSNSFTNQVQDLVPCSHKKLMIIMKKILEF